MFLLLQNARIQSFSSNLSQNHSKFSHVFCGNHYCRRIARRFGKEQPQTNENSNTDYQSSVHNNKTMVTKKEKLHYNKTHDCRCQTKVIAIVFRDMTQEKKDIVEEMGFGAPEHLPEMNVSHALLRELIDRFDEEKGCLKTLQGKIYITPQKGIVLLIRLITTNLTQKTRNVLDMSVEGKENRKKFKRTFVVFIQKCFLLPTTVSVASPIHKPPIFHVDNIREWDWAKYVLNFLMKGVENKRKGRKQSVDGCVFVLMFIYFHEIKFPRPFGPDAPPTPWVAHWTKQMMLERISSEATEPLHISIIRLNSSFEEERFSESEFQSESDKTPPAKRTRQKLVETDSESKSESKN
ncbi:hypothetical protein Ahy_B08g092154 [Arachis hypogaea]|uniref:Aminotransferase-like plant mobile domain-containing protein n=1 Tax=Arachis hypogaea TaxID=3818 RepID=A0A444Y3C4_ARAHY|nr:hypothetical protein Ahy_B08g092154 [Arachis hypogaea]